MGSLILLYQKWITQAPCFAILLEINNDVLRREKVELGWKL